MADAVITFTQGQRLTFNVNVKNTAGTTIDLTGFTASLAIQTRDGVTTHGTYTSAGGEITLAATDPNVQVAVPTADTAAWTFDMAFGDLKLTRTSDSQVLYSVRLLFNMEKQYS